MNNSENLVKNTHDETVDIKRIIFKYLYNWYWFVLRLLLAFAAVICITVTLPRYMKLFYPFC